MNSVAQTLILSCIWLCLCQIMRAEIHSIEFEDLEVLVESHPRGDQLQHGYTPHVFTVNNYGSEEQNITFTLPGIPEYEPFKINALTQTFKAPPGMHSVVVYQPPVPLSSLSNEVTIECGDQKGIIESGWEARIENFRNTGYLHRKSILLARSQNQTQLEDTYKAEMLAAAGEGGENFMHADFVTDENEIENWPVNWLAYSGYNAISISGDEWSRAIPGVQQALRHWAIAGGNLNIVGGRPEDLKGWSMGNDGKHLHIGLGRLDWITRPETANNTTPAQISTEFLQTSLANSLLHKAEGGMPLLGGLALGVAKIHQGESELFGEETEEAPGYNQCFRIIEDAKAPVLFVITMLTLFIILAGPVNLMVLNHLNKRTWFLWTLPAIALGTSGIIFIVAFLGEGIQSTIRTDSVTLLNQGSQEALTIGGIATYSPTSLPRLEFSGNSEVTPLINWRTSDSGSNRRIEWQENGEQWFTGKWVPSRIPTFFAVRKVEHRKERLSIGWNDSKPRVLNELGVDLKMLLACSQAGKVYSARKIPAGSQVDLKLLGQVELEQAGDLQDLLRANISQEDLREYSGPNPSEIPLNTYWASMEDPSPFLENPLSFKKSKHIHVGHIIGIFEEAGQ